MNVNDSIRFLANIEGRKLKFNSFDSNLPNFLITNNKVISYDNYESHDNAPRMKYFCDMLNNSILPHINNVKINSSFAIELHDSNSYLKNKIDYTNAFVWSRNKNDKKSILIPDIYQLFNYGNKLNNCIDNGVFNTKPINKIGFFGSSTGSTNPSLNKRIDMALWSIGHRDIIDCYITNIVQMSTVDLKKQIPDYEEILHKNVDWDVLFKYKFLLDIPGNTCSWDRIPLVLNSKSLLFKTECDDNTWYYPLLHSGTHFVSVDKDTIRNKKLFYENNAKEANFIIESGNRFAKTYLQSTKAHLYLKYMLEESCWWNSP